MLLLVESLSFDEIMKRAQKKLPLMWHNSLDLLKREYQRFLVLAFTSLSSEKFICRPSALIDIIWHEHILSTRQYQSDCTLIGGQFLHHTPESTSTIEEQDTVFFLKQYHLLFGEEAPSTIWNKNKNENEKTNLEKGETWICASY